MKFNVEVDVEPQLARIYLERTGWRSEALEQYSDREICELLIKDKANISITYNKVECIADKKMEDIARSLICYQNFIEGYLNGGFAGDITVTDTVVKGREVTVSYIYEDFSYGGKIYHSSREPFSKTYVFDENGRPIGDIYSILNIDKEYIEEVKNMVEEFYKELVA